MKTQISFKEAKFSLGILLLLGFLGLWTFLLTEPNLGMAYNASSLVNTTVNITNSAPLIYAISLDTPINLIAYNTTLVLCNVTVYDYDNDTLTVNATFYLDGIAKSNDSDDFNNHYTNTSCSLQGNQAREMNYSCGFNVQYFADNSSNWTCNATVKDSSSITTSNLSSQATINPLVAIKMDPVLNYGDLAVGEISNDTIANITNAGNRDANISVKGWGSTEGDGLAFTCSFGTIDLSYERYNITINSSFSSMVQLPNTSEMIEGFYVPQRVDDTNESINSTYWKVQIPIGAGGVCNGKILFSASDRG